MKTVKSVFIRICTLLTLVMFYSDMPDKTIEFESEAEDVVMVTAVPHHKAAIRLPAENALCTLP